MPVRIARAAALLSLVVLAACGGGDVAAPVGPAPTPPAPAPTPPPAPTGILALQITGLPAGVNANVAVSGPGGYAQTATASTQYTGLTGGTYTVTASSVTTAGITYTAAPPTQDAAVANGTTATATVTYTAPPPPTPPQPSGFDLTVDGFYLTQGIQDYGRTVPLVAGRDGWLRVFVRANNVNTAAARVRVRLYQGGTLVDTLIIQPPAASVPTTVDESQAANSWNVAIPGARIQSGFAVAVDADPANAFAESDESNNTLPAGGAPFAFDVRSVNTFSVRFVPVRQSANDLTGDVTGANMDSYLTVTRAVWPIAGLTAEVRPVYVTSDSALQSGDGNGAWGRILNEIRLLRSADGSQAYYAGIVKTSYSSGTAGIGYVGGRSSLAWDRSGSRSGVLAHEFGHNFGRQHAPCGSVGSSDPNYPHAGGTIGVFGWDVARANALGGTASGVVRPTTNTDLMGYCGNQWISDYSFKAALTYRTGGGGPSAVMASAAVQPTLLVWGRMTGDGVVLEPAFELATAPSLPEGRGAWRVELHDAAGALLYGSAFEPEAVADADAAGAHFAFAIPLPAARRAQVASIVVTGPAGGAVVRRAPAAIARETATPESGAARPTAAAVGVTTTRTVAGRARATWDAAAYPAALLRDARTGAVRGLVRGGAADLLDGDTELVLSDGVRSRAVRVVP